jgi:hypothetical protein
MSQPFIYLTGASGAIYPYYKIPLPRSTAGWQAVAGNYAFLKQLTNGNYLPVYIGQADNLQARLPCHDRFDDAIRAGASLVVAHSTPAGESARLAEEQDLIRKWNPALNTHHRTTG